MAHAIIPSLILAGGGGRRLGGVCKPLLRLRDGRTILERTIAEIRQASSGPVWLSAQNQHDFAGCGIPVIADAYSDAGPLAGIAAGLVRATVEGASALLIVPADLPNITSAELIKLREAWQQYDGIQVAWMRTNEERQHPLCAVVTVQALPVITAALEAGERAVYRVWERSGASAVWFADETPFANLNAPEDLRRWGIAERSDA